MRSDIYVYPFREMKISHAIKFIEYYYSKFLGVSDDEIKIKIAIHDKEIFFLKDNDLLAIENEISCFASFDTSGHDDFLACDIYLCSPDGRIADVVKHPSPILYVSDIGIRKDRRLFLGLCTAVGLAKAAGADHVFHYGGFEWLTGLYNGTPYSAKEQDIYPDGFTAEYDIPLVTLESLFATEKMALFDEALSQFYKRTEIDEYLRKYG